MLHMAQPLWVTAVDLSSIRIGVTLNFIEPWLVEVVVDCVAFVEVYNLVGSWLVEAVMDNVAYGLAVMLTAMDMSSIRIGVTWILLNRD